MDTYNMELLLLKIVSGILSFAIGVLGFVVKQMYTKVDESISRHQARILIEDKIAPVYVKQAGFEVELKRMEYKLDKILDQLMKMNRNN